MAMITCTHCGATGNAPDSILGTQVRCSKCKQTFLAGGKDEPEEPVEDQDAPAEEEHERDVDVPEDDDPPRKSKRRRDEEDDEDDVDDRPKSRSRRRDEDDEEEGEEDERPKGRKNPRDEVDDEEEDEDERPKSRSRKRGGESAIVDFVMFRKFLGPGFIGILFWVMSAVSVVFGILDIVVGASAMHIAGAHAFAYILWGVVLVFVGPAALRAICEVGVAALKTHEALAEKKEKPEGE